MGIQITPEIINILIGSGILILLAKGIFTLGEFKQRFETLEKAFYKLENKVSKLEISFQKFTKHVERQLNQVNKNLDNHEARLEIIEFAASESPITLKDEYKPLIHESGLGKQIEERLDELVSWLKKQKPKNGLEAQDMITSWVASEEIEKYLDLSKYEELLYEKGKTSGNAKAILTLYLFETIIPKVI